MTASVIDTADWLVAQPIQASGDLDLSGTPLSVAFRPISGGPIIDTASSDDGTLMFVPAAGATGPYFAIDLRVANRTWRTRAPTLVRGDILRHPDPSDLSRTEWIGRIDLRALPGSGSSGIDLATYAPVLIPAQPYEGRLVSSPLVVGPQGPPGGEGGLPPLPPDAATVNYVLSLVGGALAWVVAGSIVQPPDPGITDGVLDISDPANSGLLAAFLLAQPATPTPEAGVLDFSQAGNSGLLAALMLTSA